MVYNLEYLLSNFPQTNEGLIRQDSYHCNGRNDLELIHKIFHEYVVGMTDNEVKSFYELQYILGDLMPSCNEVNQTYLGEVQKVLDSHDEHFYKQVDRYVQNEPNIQRTIERFVKGT